MTNAKGQTNINSVIITETTVNTGVFYKHKNVVSNINYWHKFIVNNIQNVSRDEILRAILDHVHPLDLIPVSFRREKHSASFLARNCGAAIEKLCNDHLIVPKPNDFNPFKLTIILRFATTTEFKIDVQKNIISVLQTRFNATTKVLDLTNFHENKALTEFCPLSQPKIMFFVLHLSKSLVPAPEAYILRNNLIKILNPLEALSGMKINYLDLRNNLIENIEDLLPLKSFNITELILDGNPLCNKFDQQSYITSVLVYCPKIQMLDEASIRDGSGSTTKNNFLCKLEGYDVVNQFIEHFFTMYDSRNRQLMEGLYHKKAMFSITSTYIAGQLSSSAAQLRHYNNISRNLMKLADFSRNTEYLFRGSLRIVAVFNQLPLTEHDPYSFKVDLIYYTERCAVITINGVYRELPESLLDRERILGFTRTFALEILNGDGECCIVNEQLHVYNALTSQVKSSFNISKPQPTRIIPQAPNQKEQQQLADTLKIITNLTTDWSKKCLEECSYDLKKALTLFVDLYKVDKIPPQAFLNNINRS